MKINRRFLNIALVSIFLTAIIGYLTFTYMKQAAQPEQTEPIAYFRYNIDPDTILKESDVVMKNTPTSLIPKAAIKNANQVKDKRLVCKVESGDMVLSGKIVERGDVRVDTKKLWTIGVDVENISNYLGGNLKEGGDYILLHKVPEKDVTILAKIKIVSLIDSTGKLLTGNGEGVVKTINISVEQEEDILKIAANKSPNAFEIVAAPDGYEIPKEEPKDTPRPN